MDRRGNTRFGFNAWIEMPGDTTFLDALTVEFYIARAQPAPPALQYDMRDRGKKAKSHTIDRERERPMVGPFPRLRIISRDARINVLS